MSKQILAFLFLLTINTGFAIIWHTAENDLFQIIQTSSMLNGLRREKICLRRFANSKGTDQPAHQRRLISAFVICVVVFLESIISKLATSEFSIF